MEGLSPTILRLLSDRSFESRKKGAHEVETLCRRLRETNGRDALRKLVTALAEDFALAGQPNQRKGGLIGLASCAIALGPSTVEYLPSIMPAVLKNFTDPEPRVRYYACESLFNVTKICRAAILPYFPDIFGSICKLAADVDNDVKSGAGLYDRLLKEVVLETSMEGENRGVSRGGVAAGGSVPALGTSGFDVAKFVALLRGHMGVTNPYVRQLLVGWISALASMPALDMLDYLDQLLEGLFDMLSDGNREIRQAAYTTLSEFLDDMRRVPLRDVPARIRFQPMVEVLVAQTGRERDKFNRLTAVEWLTSFVALGQALLAPVLPRVIAAALHCLSDPEPEIVNDASKLNADLSRLVRGILLAQQQQQAQAGAAAAAAASRSTAPSSPTIGGASSTSAAAASNSPGTAAAAAMSAASAAAPTSAAAATASFDAPAVIAVVSRDVAAKDKTTRMAALRWLTLLLVLCPDHVMASITGTLPALVGNLADASDSEALKLNLEVLARLCVVAQPAAAGGSRGSVDGIAPSDAAAAAAASSFLDTRMLPELVRLFGANRSLLESRGSFILRRLCALLEPQMVYLSLARILVGERNREFASLVVELLSLILLTALETRDLRELLRGCAAARHASSSGASGAAGAGEGAGATPVTAADAADGGSSSGWAVFQALYRTWVVNPVATLALCLHGQAYDLCAALVASFSDVTVTVGVLMQCDKLVQLLESPIFITTRMHLAQPGRPGHASLIRALYGLLMILPQGAAYATLRDRLSAVAPLCYGGSVGAVATGGDAGAAALLWDADADMGALYARFNEVQAAYRAGLAAEARGRSLLRQPPSSGAAAAAAGGKGAAAAARGAAAGAGPSRQPSLGASSAGGGGGTRPGTPSMDDA